MVLSTVLNQTGGVGRIVEYVKEAWLEIQASRRDWNFMWDEFSESLTAGSTDYDLNAAINGGEIQIGTGPFLLVKNSDTTQRRIILLHDKSYFDDLYARTIGIATASFPTAMTTLPDGETIRFNVPLDVNYTLSGPYYLAAQVFAADADVPTNLPVRYHGAIFYRALKKWAEFEEAGEIFNTANASDQMWQTVMVNDLAPKVLVGAEALA